MKIVENVTYKFMGYSVYKYIVNDDGTTVDPRTVKKVIDLMKAFTDDKVMGAGSYVSEAAALRMERTVMSRYELRAKK